MDSATDPLLPPAPADELLALDLDIRLHEVVTWALDEKPEEAMLAAFLRLAYAVGYQDALIEPRRGQLLRDHGFPVPRRGRPRS